MYQHLSVLMIAASIALAAVENAEATKVHEVLVKCKKFKLPNGITLRATRFNGVGLRGESAATNVPKHYIFYDRPSGKCKAIIVGKRK